MLSGKKDQSKLEWRGQEVLAQNLGKYCGLFDNETMVNTFIPVFMDFCLSNKVQKVGQSAAPALAVILEKLEGDESQLKQLVQTIRRKFARSESFKRRQLFVFMCQGLLSKKEIFEKTLKSDFLRLVGDQVRNVRISLAKIVRAHFLEETNGAFIFDKDMNDAVKVMKGDDSMDVRGLVEAIQTFPLNEGNE